MQWLVQPILFLFCVIDITMLFFFIDEPRYIPYPLNFLGIIVLLLGGGMAIYHSRLFTKKHTNLLPFNEPDQLVQEGLFRYTRNPMYLGLIIALLGVAIAYQGTLSGLVIAGLFWIITDRWYVQFEERAMQQKFGKAYQDYCQRTRRWL